LHLPRKPGWVAEFQTFILRGNVVDLAVGVIIGATFTTIVTSLVKDIFNPVLGLVVGGIDFSNIFVSLNGQHYASLAEAQHAGAPTVNIGLFLNAVINFLIVGFVIFLVVKGVTRLTRKDAAETPPPEPSKTELLLEDIRDLLRSRAP